MPDYLVQYAIGMMIVGCLMLVLLAYRIARVVKLFQDVLRRKGLVANFLTQRSEADDVLTIDDQGVSYSCPDGGTKFVSWGTLQTVEILISNDCPIAPDIFWVLSDVGTSCVIPWRQAAPELMTRLQALPNFQNEVVIAAASSTKDSIRICWQRTERVKSSG